VTTVAATDICEVVITAPNPAWLLDFSYRLVDDRLAAGVHTLDQVHTVYRWEGDVHRASEARCMIRTRLALVDAIIERARREHPYVVPSIVALPIVAANPEYAAWILAQTEDLDAHHEG
jgi:periplasmic divalent cation tolerance protein